MGRGGSAPSAPRSTRDVGQRPPPICESDRDRQAPRRPGLGEGLQPRVERGRPWPARPTRRTRIALGRSTAIARTLMGLYSPRRCSCAPGVPRVQGMTEGKPSRPITRAYRTRHARDTRGAFVRLERAKAPAPARVNRSASERGWVKTADRHRTRRPIISRTADFEGCPRRLAYVWRAREQDPAMLPRRSAVFTQP